MPRSSGTMVLVAGNPVISGSAISSVVQNNTMNDVANEITNSIPRDGSAPPTANFPLGNFKITGSGAATLATDLPQYQQIQSGATNYLTSVSGTNTIIATLITPTLTSYVTGQNYTFIATTTNTGAVTLNINALGAKTVQKNGIALVAGDITTGLVYGAIYDGTNLQLTSGGTQPVGAPGFKNKIIGGDFSTNPWQRGTNFPAVANGAYTADRLFYEKGGTAVHTASKSADAPSAAQAGLYSGFSHSLLVTTAQTTLAAAEYNILSQRIEGLNSAPLGFGQAVVRTVTKSFWVKMAKTGVHCVSFTNALNRSYVAEYTIIAANTWEFKSITIPVDTSGTWNYDNTVGLSVRFALAAGTNYQTTPNTWQAGNFIATANQVNELDTVGNTFKLDLLQLEPGSTASPFDVKDADDVLRQCYRYTRPAKANARFTATAAAQSISTTIAYDTMRAAPTATINIAGSIFNSSATVYGLTATGARLDITSTSSGDAYLLDREYLLSAEL